MENFLILNEQNDGILANREELIEALVEITQSKSLTESDLEKLSDAGLAKFELSDIVDEEKLRLSTMAETLSEMAKQII